MKKENGKYYAIVNVVTEVEELKKTGENIGIDLGLKTLVTLSNTQEIANLDLSQEETMIKKIPEKNCQEKKYMSKNYQKTLKKYHKWVDRKNNKIKNTYHHISKKIVENYDIISMEDLNIKGMFKNKKWSHKLQQISLYTLLQMIKYKAEWYGKKFIQIDRYYPSSKKCRHCGKINHELKLHMRKWKCPNCNKINHRDINASINILNEGIRIISSE